ncbi:hypothetical protein CesoFtcFv8_011959 [Champsocephalus esox]|uniref:Syntaphilin n=1 Tax=Champsocephalus esox TaxID=159716 RepID=A0AAN8C5A5_9TELE|nr:hypothetical protein CesoFtcFv8_011959 [Champsocephalus esox]
MSLPPSRKPSSGQRRRSVGTVNGRFSLSETSITHPGKIRGDGSPAARTLPNTPRRQVKLSCSENHGIRAPPPEQYLTPMQQKELCIRHLRARLRDNVERLQHRDSEISGLRAQLLRMQEDWIHEEVQRLEAHLELQEARREISVLQDEPEGLRGPRQTHLLLLEAAMLSEPRGHNSTRGPSSSPTSSPCSSSYERLFLPVSHSCSCIAHTPHTHLYLHLPQEEARGPASDPPIPTPTPPCGEEGGSALSGLQPHHQLAVGRGPHPPLRDTFSVAFTRRGPSSHRGAA